jgi:hypothetical protein
LFTHLRVLLDVENGLNDGMSLARVVNNFIGGTIKKIEKQIGECEVRRVVRERMERKEKGGGVLIDVM